MQHPSYDPSSQPTQPGFGSTPPPHAPNPGQGFPPIPGQSPGHGPYPPGERHSHVKTWGVIAAVVSAAAGVASAAAAFMGGGGSSNPAPAPQVTVTVGAQAGAGAGGVSAPSSPAPAASAPGAAAKVLWSGPFLLGMQGVDLTSIPPASGDPKAIVFLRPDAQRSSGGMVIKGTVARWTEPGEPTAEGCRQQLTTQKRTEVDVSVGDRVCVVEGNSPIGVFKVTGVHADDGIYGELDAVLTVWDLHMKR